MFPALSLQLAETRYLPIAKEFGTGAVQFSMKRLLLAKAGQKFFETNYFAGNAWLGSISCSTQYGQKPTRTKVSFPSFFLVPDKEKKGHKEDHKLTMKNLTIL